MFTNLFNTIYFIKNDNLWVYFVKNSLFFEKTVSCMYRKSLNFKKQWKIINRYFINEIFFSSKNERILADYILKHPEDVLKMSSKDLGKACFVSTATVYRLCDKLNLAGFSDLKIKITSSLNDYLKSNGDFNFDFPVNPYQTHYEIVHKIKEDYEQTLNLTANIFSLDQLRLIASAMKKAKVIDIYTSAGNINFALNFQF